MKPQEKAQELVGKFKYNTRAFNETNGWEDTIFNAKQCALIAVDEILNLGLNSVGDYKCFDDPCEWYISYWEEVKHEIEKL